MYPNWQNPGAGYNYQQAQYGWSQQTQPQAQQWQAQPGLPVWSGFLGYNPNQSQPAQQQPAPPQQPVQQEQSDIAQKSESDGTVQNDKKQAEPAPPLPSTPAPPVPVEPPSEVQPPLPPEPPPDAPEPAAVPKKELKPKSDEEQEKLTQLLQQAQQWQQQQYQVHTQPQQWPQAAWQQGWQQQWAQYGFQQYQQPPPGAPPPAVPQQAPPNLHQPAPPNTQQPPPVVEGGDPMYDAILKEEGEFNEQYTQWKKQYDDWKIQNQNHPNKEQFQQYEQQWQMYEKQMEDKRQDITTRKLQIQQNIAAKAERELMQQQQHEQPPQFPPGPDKQAFQGQPGPRFGGPQFPGPGQEQVRGPRPRMEGAPRTGLERPPRPGIDGAPSGFRGPRPVGEPRAGILGSQQGMQHGPQPLIQSGGRGGMAGGPRPGLGPRGPDQNQGFRQPFGKQGFGQSNYGEDEYDLDESEYNESEDYYEGGNEGNEGEDDMDLDNEQEEETVDTNPQWNRPEQIMGQNQIRGQRPFQGQGPRSEMGQGPRTQMGQGPRAQLGQGPRAQMGQGPRPLMGQGPRAPLGQGPRHQFGQGPRPQMGQGPRPQMGQSLRFSGDKSNMGQGPKSWMDDEDENEESNDISDDYHDFVEEDEQSSVNPFNQMGPGLRGPRPFGRGNEMGGQPHMVGSRGPRGRGQNQDFSLRGPSPHLRGPNPQLRGPSPQLRGPNSQMQQRVRPGGPVPLMSLDLKKPTPGENKEETNLETEQTGEFAQQKPDLPLNQKERIKLEQQRAQAIQDSRQWSNVQTQRQQQQQEILKQQQQKEMQKQQQDQQEKEMQKQQQQKDIQNQRPQQRDKEGEGNKQQGQQKQENQKAGEKPDHKKVDGKHLTSAESQKNDESKDKDSDKTKGPDQAQQPVKNEDKKDQASSQNKDQEKKEDDEKDTEGDSKPLGRGLAGVFQMLQQKGTEEPEEPQIPGFGDVPPDSNEPPDKTEAQTHRTRGLGHVLQMLQGDDEPEQHQAEQTDQGMQGPDQGNFPWQEKLLGKMHEILHQQEEDVHPLRGRGRQNQQPMNRGGRGQGRGLGRGRGNMRDQQENYGQDEYYDQFGNQDFQWGRPEFEEEQVFGQNGRGRGRGQQQWGRPEFEEEQGFGQNGRGRGRGQHHWVRPEFQEELDFGQQNGRGRGGRGRGQQQQNRGRGQRGGRGGYGRDQEQGWDRDNWSQDGNRFEEGNNGDMWNRQQGREFGREYPEFGRFDERFPDSRQREEFDRWGGRRSPPGGRFASPFDRPNDPYVDRRDPFGRDPLMRDPYGVRDPAYRFDERRPYFDDPYSRPYDYGERFPNRYEMDRPFQPPEVIDHGHKSTLDTEPAVAYTAPQTVIDYGHGRSADNSNRLDDRGDDRGRYGDRDRADYGRDAPYNRPVTGPIHEPKIETVNVDDILLPPGRKNRPAQIVVILRGLPGSGKTYVGKLLKDKEVQHGGGAPRMLCLDDYFMVETEKIEKDPETGKRVKKKILEYEYEAGMEDSYRQNMYKSFKKTIDDGFFSFIIVDAVNEKTKHFEEFWSHAKSKGFQVYIAELQAEVATCAKRNTHKRSVKEIEKIKKQWQETPRHYLRLDIRSLLQEVSITEVEMEDEVATPAKKQKKEEEDEEDDNDDGFMSRFGGVYKKSKWEIEASGSQLDKLDGIRLGKRKRSPSPKTMEEFLQLAGEYSSRPLIPGQKRVRWADVEERKEQMRRREIGFVVGQTQRDWERITDDSFAERQLNRTKYF